MPNTSIVNAIIMGWLWAGLLIVLLDAALKRNPLFRVERSLVAVYGQAIFITGLPVIFAAMDILGL